MSTKSPKVESPPEPDPTPTVTSDPSPEVQEAARNAKKRALKNYGRQNTIIAGLGSDTGNENQKKTILGG